MFLKKTIFSVTKIPQSLLEIPSWKSVVFLQSQSQFVFFARITWTSKLFLPKEVQVLIYVLWNGPSGKEKVIVRYCVLLAYHAHQLTKIFPDRMQANWTTLVKYITVVVVNSNRQLLQIDEKIFPHSASYSWLHLADVSWSPLRSERWVIFLHSRQVYKKLKSSMSCWAGR